MPLTLHLGVVDLPYVQPALEYKTEAHVRRGHGPHKAHAAQYQFSTTGDVAEKLERDYGVMEYFFDWHAQEIVGDLEDGLRGALESLCMGAPVQLAPFGSGISKIEERFRDFLSLREMDMRVPGVPTRAAQLGINHRFKSPRMRRVKGKGIVPREPRPSFIDTGLYEASMKAWID